MVSNSGNIVLYAKAGVFEYDEEDGTIHAVFRAHGMETRIIQNRHYFIQTGIRADAMRKVLASKEGEVVKLPKQGKKRKH